MDTDRFNELREQRDEARERLDKLAAIILPAMKRAEAQSPLDLRVTVLAAALRELAPLLTPDQRAELLAILKEDR